MAKVPWFLHWTISAFSDRKFMTKKLKNMLLSHTQSNQSMDHANKIISTIAAETTTFNFVFSLRFSEIIFIPLCAVHSIHPYIDELC